MKNKNGIEIKACCASCQHRLMTVDDRICGLTKASVASDYSCNRWRMEKLLQNAGNGGGKVKKWQYLCFFMEHWIKQRNDLEAGSIAPTQLQSVEQIRKEYNELHGSEFINI